MVSFKEQLRNDTNSKGSKVVAEWPMCALVEQGSEGVAKAMTLPPMKLARHMLADKAASKQGNFVERPTNVFKPGEEIFIYAYFGNVGRINAMPMSSYEIGLDIEVRDRAGQVLKTFPNAHVLRANAPPSFPVSAKHFTNFVTAGIALHDPGDYIVAYIFSDHSRSKKPAVTAAFDVKVK